MSHSAMTDDPIEPILAGQLGHPANELASAVRHPNRHFRVGPYFVKVFAGHPAYADAEIAAAGAVPGEIATPRLVRTGHIADRGIWLAYEWQDFTAVTVCEESAREAGAVAGALHAKAQPRAALRDRDARALPKAVQELALRTAEFDAALARRIQALLDAIPPRPVPFSDQAGLLHGDFGWRNLCRGRDQRLWVIDFEHARWGHPYLEFAKAWDRELAEPGLRQAFLDGYATVAPVPPPAARDLALIRLWAAAGIFPYAQAHGDRDFAGHGLIILDRLEADLREGRS